MAEEPVTEFTFVGVEAAQARIKRLSAYVVELRAEKFHEVAERVIADNHEILQRLALIEKMDDEALLARAKELAAAAEPAEAVTYTEDDLDALRHADVIVVLADDDDFFVEDEPVEDVLAAFEASEHFLTEQPNRGTGWCAPSP